MAARSPLEKAICIIWQDVLGISAVGVHDKFSELGGHSLLGLQVIARVHELLEVKLEIHDLYKYPTVESLSNAIVCALAYGAQSLASWQVSSSEEATTALGD
jgi:acyl carrier protein